MADRSMAQARKDPIGRRMKIGGSQNKISSPDLRLPPKQFQIQRIASPATKDTCRERSSDSDDLFVCTVAPALPPGCPATRSEAPRELGLELARWRPRGRAGPRWPPTRRSRAPFASGDGRSTATGHSVRDGAPRAGTFQEAETEIPSRPVGLTAVTGSVGTTSGRCSRGPPARGGREGQCASAC